MRLAGKDVNALSGRGRAEMRGTVAAMIFQEPLTALDPVYTVGRQIVETILCHRPLDREVAIDPPSCCRFRTRCAFGMPRCAEAIPPPVAVGDAHHMACYVFEGECPAPIAA